MEPILTSLIINTVHLEAMLQFYQRIGLQFETKKISKGGECYQSFLGGVEVIFYAVKQTATDPSPAPQMQLTIQIKEIDAMFADLLKISGVQGLLDPTLLADGKKAILLDPDGRSVELIQVES